VHLHYYSRVATAQKYLLNRNLGGAILLAPKKPLENPGKYIDKEPDRGTFEASRITVVLEVVSPLSVRERCRHDARMP